jgi:flagellar basal-body rod protein FlgG
VSFPNPAGLSAIGRNLFTASGASGDALTGTPGQEGLGTVAQGMLELSNVSVVDEMVNMISGQRAYELNSKVIQTTDNMLQTATSIKR